MVGLLTRPLRTRKAGLRYILALGLVSLLAIAPLGVAADSSGGSLSGYLAYRAGANTNSVWSPLFRFGFEGWTTTLAITNLGTSAVRVEFRAKSFDGTTQAPVSQQIPGRGTRLFTGGELGLRDGFNGTISATATDGRITGVAIQDSANADRITLLSPEAAGNRLYVPLAFNDTPTGWNSIVVVQNPGTSDAPAKITYRVEGKPEVERTVTIPNQGGRVLDLEGLEKGPMSVQVEAQGSAQLVAAAYHINRDGSTSANVGANTGAQKVYIPLLFRRSGNENAFVSGVQVVTAIEGAVQPRITFTDRDTGDRIGPIASESSIREGHSYTWYLPAIESLRDGKVYSAEVETDGSAGIVAIANHVNAARRLAAVYPGAGRGDSTLTAPVVYKNADGMNSGIQVQNLGSDASVRVSFRTQQGATIEGTTETFTVPARSSYTLYLPAVTGLPDGFIGSAEISSTGGQIAAVVNNVRYRGSPAPASAPAPVSPAAPSSGM